MKKEQEEEAAKRVSEERNRRAADDQRFQQRQQSTSNGRHQIKQQEMSPMSYQPIRQPSPPRISRSETPPSPVSSSAIYQNIGDRYTRQISATNEEKNEEPARFIGGVNVSSLLRQRKTSSSSKSEDDDEWTDDHYLNNQQHSFTRSLSPTPAIQSEQSSNSYNEGIKCIARYSYQKGKPMNYCNFLKKFVLF